MRWTLMILALLIGFAAYLGCQSASADDDDAATFVADDDSDSGGNDDADDDAGDDTGADDDDSDAAELTPQEKCGYLVITVNGLQGRIVSLKDAVKECEALGNWPQCQNWRMYVEEFANRDTPSGVCEDLLEGFYSVGCDPEWWEMMTNG